MREGLISTYTDLAWGGLVEVRTYTLSVGQDIMYGSGVVFLAYTIYRSLGSTPAAWVLCDDVIIVLLMPFFTFEYCMIWLYELYCQSLQPIRIIEMASKSQRDLVIHQ